MSELNPMEIFRKRIGKYQNSLDENALYEEYKSFITTNVKFYASKGIDRNDIINECLYLLFENYRKYTSQQKLLSKIALKKYINSKLRTYFNHEIKERHISYGTNPENCNI